MIKIEKLTKKFGEKEVLKNISIVMEEGRTYGVVGENGAGKTTLFRCIAGLEKYIGSVGSAYEKLSDQIGFLQTTPFFFSKITGREYIRLVCSARDKDVGNIDSRNIFDLPLDQYASTYSTGMKKKLAITAMLMQENQVYILDEPFNGVDIKSNIIIEEIINKLKELGKTIIIASHIFATLRNVCDQMYLIKAGEIVRSVETEDFDLLEEELKRITVGSKIDKFGLR